MKSFLVVAAFAATALAQANLGGLPDCAKSCVDLNHLGNCKQLDIKCICSSKEFIDGISCCVSKSCTSKTDQDNTLKFAKGICSPVGVTDLPKSATCAAGAASTPASTGSSSSTGGSSTSSGSSAAATGTGSSSSAASGTATSSSGSSAAGSATPAASSPGVAGHVVAQGAAAMGGMVLAAFL